MKLDYYSISAVWRYLALVLSKTLTVKFNSLFIYCWGLQAVSPVSIGDFLIMHLHENHFFYFTKLEKTEITKT